MNENPHAAPTAAQQKVPRLDAPITIGGVSSTRLVREVNEHFDGRPKYLKRYSAFLWGILMVLAASLLVFLEVRKMPASYSQVESIAAAVAKHWYVMVGLMIYFAVYTWLFFAQSSNDEIEQDYTFTNDGIKLKNENLAAEIPWKSVKCQNSDQYFIQLELAAPNSGTLVVDRKWCEDESTWNSLCQFLHGEFSEQGVG